MSDGFTDIQIGNVKQLYKLPNRFLPLISCHETHPIDPKLYFVERKRNDFIIIHDLQDAKSSRHLTKEVFQIIFKYLNIASYWYGCKSEIVDNPSRKENDLVRKIQIINTTPRGKKYTKLVEIQLRKFVDDLWWSNHNDINNIQYVEQLVQKLELHLLLTPFFNNDLKKFIIKFVSRSDKKLNMQKKLLSYQKLVQFWQILGLGCSLGLKELVHLMCERFAQSHSQKQLDNYRNTYIFKNF